MLFFHAVAPNVSPNTSFLLWQVLFFHAVALNVALNSHNNILITLLISNNFVELKTNVFKKVERENLFQVGWAYSWGWG